MTNNNEQRTMYYSKQTQSNPTCSELACPELACGELVEPVEGVEPISKWRKPCLTARALAQGGQAKNPRFWPEIALKPLKPQREFLIKVEQ
jgi:hypothetical protein